MGTNPKGKLVKNEIEPLDLFKADSHKYFKTLKMEFKKFCEWNAEHNKPITNWEWLFYFLLALLLGIAFLIYFLLNST